MGARSPLVCAWHLLVLEIFYSPRHLPGWYLVEWHSVTLLIVTGLTRTLLNAKCLSSVTCSKVMECQCANSYPVKKHSTKSRVSLLSDTMKDACLRSDIQHCDMYTSERVSLCYLSLGWQALLRAECLCWVTLRTWCLSAQWHSALWHVYKWRSVTANCLCIDKHCWVSSVWLEMLRRVPACTVTCKRWHLAVCHAAEWHSS